MGGQRIAVQVVVLPLASVVVIGLWLLSYLLRSLASSIDPTRVPRRLWAKLVTWAGAERRGLRRCCVGGASGDTARASVVWM